uniref:Uncharacterized protein n=1 Tax=Ditylenchus dipsaci TaxID=166011 RepID=A0A915DTR4_9BILA
MSEGKPFNYKMQYRVEEDPQLKKAGEYEKMVTNKYGTYPLYAHYCDGSGHPGVGCAVIPLGHMVLQYRIDPKDLM